MFVRQFLFIVVTVVQAEVWCCSCLNGTTWKELIVGNTILLQMRNAQLQHELGELIHAWTNVQIDKHIVSLTL